MLSLLAQLLSLIVAMSAFFAGLSGWTLISYESPCDYTNPAEESAKSGATIQSYSCWTDISFGLRSLLNVTECRCLTPTPTLISTEQIDPDETFDYVGSQTRTWEESVKYKDCSWDSCEIAKEAGQVIFYLWALCFVLCSIGCIVQLCLYAIRHDRCYSAMLHTYRKRLRVATGCCWAVAALLAAGVVAWWQLHTQPEICKAAENSDGSDGLGQWTIDCRPGTALRGFLLVIAGALAYVFAQMYEYSHESDANGGFGGEMIMDENGHYTEITGSIELDSEILSRQIRNDQQRIASRASSDVVFF